MFIVEVADICKQFLNQKVFRTLSIFLVTSIFALGVSAEPITNMPLSTLDGKDFVLYPEIVKIEKGKLVVINFTSTTCKPCKVEIPKLIAFHKENKTKFDFWLVLVGDSPDKITKFKKEMRIPTDVWILKDPGELSLIKLKFSGVPATFVVNNKKELIHQEIGYTEEKFEQIKNKVLGYVEN